MLHSTLRTTVASDVLQILLILIFLVQEPLHLRAMLDCLPEQVMAEHPIGSHEGHAKHAKHAKHTAPHQQATPQQHDHKEDCTCCIPNLFEMPSVDLQLFSGSHRVDQAFQPDGQEWPSPQRPRARSPPALLT